MSPYTLDATTRAAKVNLIDVYGNDAAPDILYRLLEERPPSAWISHQKMPTRKAHARFIKRRPFLYWYLIKEYGGTYVGALECNSQNELGVSILYDHQGFGFGREALRLFMKMHKPKPAIPAKRVGSWLANIGIKNEDSKSFFAEMGFTPVQETWRHE